MARSITEIKQSIVDTYSSDDNVRIAYGLVAGQSLNLSKASIENALFYAMAVAIYVFEVILDQHLKNLKTILYNDKPHTSAWYCTKTKEYQHGCLFNEDSMSYDNSQRTDDEIEQTKVVKFCAASEENVTVILKVAGEGPQPLTEAQLAGVTAYMNRVKDAGVFLQFRNVNADSLKITIKVWYNPMIIDETGKNITANTEQVKECVESFVKKLPFNSEFHLDKLEDAIQTIDGVEIVRIVAASTRSVVNQTWQAIDGYTTPYSGYYNFEQDTDLNIGYYPYNNGNTNI